jgi:glucosamine--fructose-6-phosphate aminotransferase (isomerizing)
MNHPYNCYFEIINQAEAWQEAVDNVLAKSESILAFFDEMDPGEIIFTGCTSPYYAGISSSVYWQSALGIQARAVPCSELIQYPSSFYSTRKGKPVLVVLSRSGKTTETLWAVEQFEKKFPGRTLLIGCLPNSPLEKMIPMNVMLPKAYEETVPQTRSFASMYLAAQMVGAIISRQVKTLNSLKNAPGIVKRIIADVEETIKEIYKDKIFKNIFYLGSGPFYGVARESTLKMIEMTISDTICVPFMESRHGPRSLIDENSLVVGLYGRAGNGYEAKVMDELTRNQGANTVAIIPDPNWDSGKVTYKLSVDCDWPDDILGLSYVPCIHLLAYYCAVAKGVNPDTSRNLTSYIEIART